MPEGEPVEVADETIDPHTRMLMNIVRRIVRQHSELMAVLHELQADLQLVYEAVLQSTCKKLLFSF